MTTVKTVQSITTSFGTTDLTEFKSKAFSPGLPLRFSNRGGHINAGSLLPASSKWFENDTSRPLLGHVTFSSRIKEFAHHQFPYELNHSQGTDEDGTAHNPVEAFIQWLSDHQGDESGPMNAVLAGLVHAAVRSSSENQSSYALFDAPLLLLVKAIEFNKTTAFPLRQLYIAQSQLADLPGELQLDLPTPRIVLEAGKGDVYSSSVWMGLEPTYTPFHRDPNPNLFCQLLNSKTIRLLPPKDGDVLYRQIQSRLMRSGSSRLRGSEMMDGPERVMLKAKIWGSEPPEEILETELAPGDALYIPLGWWHSVKSTHMDGRLNASANWWFR